MKKKQEKAIREALTDIKATIDALERASAARASAAAAGMDMLASRRSMNAPDVARLSAEHLAFAEADLAIRKALGAVRPETTEAAADRVMASIGDAESAVRELVEVRGLLGALAGETASDAARRRLAIATASSNSE